MLYQLSYLGGFVLKLRRLFVETDEPLGRNSLSSLTIADSGAGAHKELGSDSQQQLWVWANFHRHRLKPSTWRIYRSNLVAYCESLSGGQLRDLTPPKIKAHVNRFQAAGKIYAAHNKMIALKALAEYE